MAKDAVVARLKKRRSAQNHVGRWVIPRGANASLWQSITPPQLFTGSFVILIVVGTLGLKLLPGLYVGDNDLSWRDAIFTATSAACINGLVVVDTATFFTPLGQAFLLALIQLGGLGMLAFTSLIISLLGRRLSLRVTSLAAESRKMGPHVDVRRLTLNVVCFTLLIEFVGAVTLYLLWAPDQGWGEAAWPAVFHSVSAFCNAGFSTYSDSMIPFRRSPATLMVISLLIVAGGLGFLTLEEFYSRLRRRGDGRTRRISVHSHLVLVTTAVLLLGAWPLFALFEWNGELRGLSTVDKSANAFFMSATPRSGGFNSINYGAATDSTNMLTILLMIVGGSPGSTAGGIKTTTIALIILLAWSRIRGHETTIFGNRSIPDDTIQRAVGVTVIAFALVAVGVFALATSEQYGHVEGTFLFRMFEAVSAFNTTGLSMGLTPKLSSAGRWVTILLMFLGRVGPLTLAAALIIRRPRGSNFRYAYEDVVVG